METQKTRHRSRVHRSLLILLSVVILGVLVYVVYQRFSGQPSDGAGVVDYIFDTEEVTPESRGLPTAVVWFLIATGAIAIGIIGDVAYAHFHRRDVSKDLKHLDSVIAAVKDSKVLGTISTKIRRQPTEQERDRAFMGVLHGSYWLSLCAFAHKGYKEFLEKSQEIFEKRLQDTDLEKEERENLENIKTLTSHELSVSNLLFDWFHNREKPDAKDNVFKGVENMGVWIHKQMYPGSGLTDDEIRDKINPEDYQDTLMNLTSNDGDLRNKLDIQNSNAEKALQDESDLTLTTPSGTKGGQEAAVKELLEKLKTGAFTGKGSRWWETREAWAESRKKHGAQDAQEENDWNKWQKSSGGEKAS